MNWNFFKYPIWVSCSGKNKYKTLNDANLAGKNSMYKSNYSYQLYIYECQYCNQYHLTNQHTENRVF